MTQKLYTWDEVVDIIRREVSLRISEISAPCSNPEFWSTDVTCEAVLKQGTPEETVLCYKAWSITETP